MGAPQLLMIISKTESLVLDTCMVVNLKPVARKQIFSGDMKGGHDLLISESGAADGRIKAIQRDKEGIC
jgi:hypothetical protein